MKIYCIYLISFILIGCHSKNEKSDVSTTPRIKLTLEEANRLSRLPLHCMQVEYPNKLSQVLSDSTGLKSPRELHPAFYGCFDWHSSVHGHWMLVRLLKEFPDIDDHKSIKAKLYQNISRENILSELSYFRKDPNYERTYGWAWLLKLAEELHTWESPFAKGLEKNLQPLTDYIVQRYLEFLPKLHYPIRVGEHSNTAFGMSFALDFAQTTGHAPLKDLISQRARDFYINDQSCPIDWEPSGFDFLSPCLEEANIMKKVLSNEEFSEWIQSFLPQLSQSDFILQPGIVSDRSDGKLVHLDGVNFSRAWCLYNISEEMEGLEHLKTLANSHISYSLPHIVDNNYEGTHWLASFAVYALNHSD
ncbi:DUF2891 domain-containing protein [Membranihabitans maritimus]|uniref:DUF2891 domain-containing protein n=1 Tax=Membranihabitans maritimus TaxID=2904244 RepID=UPI002104CAD7|nr:DUF2891 domain-containing protein [Membranihabitans maritimus]